MDSPAPPPPPPPIGLDSLQAPAVPPPLLGGNTEFGLGPPPTNRDSFIPGPPSADRMSFNHAKSPSPVISPPPPKWCGSTPQAVWLHLPQAAWLHPPQAVWPRLPPSGAAPPPPSSVAPPPPPSSNLALQKLKKLNIRGTPPPPGLKKALKAKKAGPPGFVTAPP